MKIDWNKVMLGAGVGLGAAIIYNRSRPASKRASVGDKVLIRALEGQIPSAAQVDSVKIYITSATPTHVTGEPYEWAMLPGAARPQLTFPRESIVDLIS